MIASMTQGRLRLRSGALKVEEIAREARERLLDLKGVVEVQVNQRVGSLLVFYDKARIGAEALLRRAAELLHVDLERLRAGVARADKALRTPQARRAVKAGMAGALILAVGALAVSGKAHAGAGVLFLALGGVHMVQNRRTLLR
jgi:hypothetical protein